MLVRLALLVSLSFKQTDKNNECYDCESALNVERGFPFAYVSAAQSSAKPLMRCVKSEFNAQRLNEL